MNITLKNGVSKKVTPRLALMLIRRKKASASKR
jgi:hypothetical protein